MGTLSILGRVTSINVRKVMWTCDLIGIGYEVEIWGMPHRDPKAPEFLKLNPNAQVPVIIDDGFVLWESNAIMRYLSESRRSGLWPVAVQERALVDQWLTWQVAELNAQWGYAVYALSGGFAANGRLSIADIGLAVSTHRWFSTPFDKPELPAVAAHYQMLKATAEGQKYMSADTP